MDKGKCCQSKSHIFKLLLASLTMIFIVSCADLEVEELPVVKTEPVWFQAPAPFQWMEANGDVQLHPFYDMVPFSSAIDQSINFFPLFSTKSDFFRDFDMLSGKSFKRFEFCQRDDVWRKREGILSAPNFTYGVVPRLIDQLGMPQNIVVFGNEGVYQDELEKGATLSHRVRVVGGVLHQFCDEYPCATEDEWRSRLVLIAVDTADKKYEKVREWEGLKEVADWPYAKSFLENLYGGTVSGEMIKPSYRVSGEIDGKKSLDAAVKKGHLFRFDEMTALKKGCHKLYDYVWDSAQLIRSFESKRVSERKDGERPKFRSFSAFFSDFYKNYGQQYRTCISRVHNGTLNANISRFWFFAYFDGFFHQERLGYFFRCPEGVWSRNPIDPTTGKYFYDTKKLYSRCSSKQLDTAFESVSLFSLGNGNTGNAHIRFIEYDNGNALTGTHDRLYTWNSFTGKGYLCRSKSKIVTNVDDMNKIDYFPRDIYWQRFGRKGINGAIIGKSEFSIED